jgi:hypothetical protein
MSSSQGRAASGISAWIGGLEPAALFLVAGALYVWLGWGWLQELHSDQGWFLQVAERVAGGERLYGDVLWCYGPLPVLLMSSWMQLGRFDITYYSALNVGMAIAATLLLYGVHRCALSRRAAAGITFAVMLGFAAATLFLRSPSPVVGLGFIGLLLVLLGIFRAGQAQPALLNTAWIAAGIALACLSKHEFAFAALVLSGVALVSLARVRCRGIVQAAALRQIALGSALGVGSALALYAALAIESGWDEVWAGVSGYGLISDSASLLSGAWFRSVPFGSLVALLGLVGWLALSSRAHSLLGWGARPSTAVALAAFLILAIAFRSGMLQRISQAEVSLFDVEAWRASIARNPPRSWIRLAGLLVHALLWCLTASVFIGLLARWCLRWWRREQATREQWMAWMLVVCIQASTLRAILDTASPLNLWGLPLLAFLLGAELPRWSLARVTPRSLAVAALLLCGLAIGFARGWQVKPSESVWMSTPYGRARVLPQTRDFLGEVVAYLERNSLQGDSIAVFGRWAGIWYLGQRRDPFRAGYQVAGMGVEEADAPAFLERLETAQPAVLLVPQGAWNVGLLDVRGASPGERVPAFEQLAPQVERQLLERYAFDRVLNGGSPYEVAAFKRVR